jgi:hypothetical protein
MYAARSQGYHGATVEVLRADPNDSNLNDLSRLRSVLRATVKRSLLDPAFQAVFTDEAAIRANWPVADGNGEPI